MTAACLLVRSPACSARQLQTSIVQVVHLCPTGFRKEPCERLERHKPKGLRVVLRGLGSSNAPRLPGGGGGDVTSLPDTWVGNHPGLPGPRTPRIGRRGRQRRWRSVAWWTIPLETCSIVGELNPIGIDGGSLMSTITQRIASAFVVLCGRY